MSQRKVILEENIESKIFVLRQKRVMLDRDLASLYGVTTSNLNKAVRRNESRFPLDFMFQLKKEEYESLRFQNGILKRGQHSKYLPYAFTEHGILMLSSVLNSERAINVNIQIMRTFTKLREMMISHKDLQNKIEKMEEKFKAHDYNFQIVFDAIRKILEKPEKMSKKIGFHA